MNNKILIIDIETTGWLKQGGSIVEIGIVEVCAKTREINTVYDQICREDILTIEHFEKPFGWIFENSDLEIKDVINGKPFDIVKKEVQDIINNYPSGITAFNKRFDFEYLRDRGIVIDNELPCLMHSCTDICKMPKKGRKGHKWPSVEEAYKHFYDDEYIEKHRAADDAIHEALIAIKLIELGII